jgi:hypothetical protein
MPRRSLPSLVAVIAATLGVYACTSETPLVPTQSASAVSGSGSTGSSYYTLPVADSEESGTPYLVSPLRRTSSLSNDIEVRKTIGALGGTIVLSTGLTVIVPPLAVKSPTEFRIKARKGAYLAYDFEPHGIKFGVPLKIIQSLQGVQNADSIIFCYYPDASKMTLVTQLRSVVVDPNKLTATTSVTHFSGYIFAGGRGGDDDGGY